MGLIFYRGRASPGHYGSRGGRGSPGPRPRARFSTPVTFKISEGIQTSAIDEELKASRNGSTNRVYRFLEEKDAKQR